jgi:peptidoglycan/LPS O-acetylase OafA/YrhL
MNKALIGLLVGGVLGIFDGLTAWFTPEARSQLVQIVIGSTVKGVIAGVLIGYFARKVNSLALGIVFGLAVGLMLAYAVAAMQPGPNHYYFAIMLPGGIVGAIIGYATQRYGEPSQPAAH